MTFREAFVTGARRLAAGSHPTESPELDARLLLAHVASLSHAGLLARWAETVVEPIAQAYEQALLRRLEGEPVAWIVGKKEFLGMDFEVGPGLLVPRADTETLVEAALEVLAGRLGCRVVDVCTGTGCVAVGLAALAPQSLEVWAGDVSPLAVDTARRNAQRLLTGRAVEVRASDLLSQLPGPWDLVVSNPPYLTPDETLDRVGNGGWKEPALALDGGGADGLDLIRRLVTEAGAELAPGGWFLLEAAGPQMPALQHLLEGINLQLIRTWKDLAGVERVIGGQRVGTPALK